MVLDDRIIIKCGITETETFVTSNMQTMTL